MGVGLILSSLLFPAYVGMLSCVECECGDDWIDPVCSDEIINGLESETHVGRHSRGIVPKKAVAVRHCTEIPQ